LRYFKNLTGVDRIGCKVIECFYLRIPATVTKMLLGGAVDYITEVNSAMNLTVVFQMLGVGLLLTLVASLASVLFIMRYDPLKILANRD